MYSQEWPKELHEVLDNSTFLLSEIDKVLAKRLARLDDMETFDPAYENPNWAYWQAYINGQKKQLKTLRKLLQK